MKINSEQKMLEFGKDFAANLTTPSVIELIGDVGTGKTTFVRGLAAGLGIKDKVTSPSFTISKAYALPNQKLLFHYDFYRLDDPGLMSEDLSESIRNSNAITVVEWANSIEDFLPKTRIKIHFKYNDDDTREVTIL
ncbi:MAG: tRNA (adenosine(37)-N6)-threonylcarbamoyltransferase complex ATPase subunit type 1 TsaE [Candidatus Saccharibacteria bacterium]|nr:tRNA (adenosine(37)-N6)-threonylcarbamoyltransferase complex ATPase subunit type 1 TsaE [Candidatus Saccharibacteria bacterium]